MADKKEYPKYEVQYFNAKGLAEPIRWILAYKEIPFTDTRISTDDDTVHEDGFKAWGKLPILLEDGRQLFQSRAIARYLAQKYDVAGANEYETHLCDEYVEHLVDLLAAFWPWYLTPDKEQRELARKNILENVLPPVLQKFEELNLRQPGPFLLGDRVTYADFYFAAYMDILEADQFVGPKLLDNYPFLRQHKLDVLAIPQIAEQVAKNPDALPCCAYCQRFVVKDSKANA